MGHSMGSLDKSGVDVLPDVQFFVEATGCEQHYIWRDYHEKCDWVQISQGFMTQIGFIGNPKKNRQVWASFSFAKLNGVLIAFYEVTSRYADSKLMEEYLKPFMKKYDETRNTHTDANNFHNCFHFIKDESSKVIDLKTNEEYFFKRLEGGFAICTNQKREEVKFPGSQIKKKYSLI